jgi:hypothetical protein
MKRIVLIIVLPLFLAGISCNFLNRGLEQIGGTRINLSGATKSENRPVSGFTKVQLDGFGDLSINFGTSESLVVEADENLLPYIITEVQGETLIISMKENVNVINMVVDVNYTLTAKSLESVDLNGLGNITVNSWNAEAPAITLDGSGSITIAEVVADSLTTNLNGLGSLTINGGKVTGQNVTLAGAGSYQAGDMVSENASISLTGLGSATVWVTGTLDAELTGAGSLDYYGKPQATLDDTGLGSINSLGEK